MQDNKRTYFAAGLTALSSTSSCSSSPELSAGGQLADNQCDNIAHGDERADAMGNEFSWTSAEQIELDSVDGTHLQGCRLEGGSPEPISAKMPRGLWELRDHLFLSQEDYLAFLHKVGAFSGTFGFLFRGLSDAEYRLLPSIVRENLYNIAKEKDAIELLKARKRGDWGEFADSLDEDLFYSATARHLGLPSRLLDWTSSLETALSFAIYDNVGHAGTLWVMAIDRLVGIKQESRSPFGIKDSRVHVLKSEYFSPRQKHCMKEWPAGTQRNFKQGGLFTVTAPEYSGIPLEEMPALPECGITLIPIVISVLEKKTLRKSGRFENPEDSLLPDPDAETTEIINSLKIFLKNENKI